MKKIALLAGILIAVLVFATTTFAGEIAIPEGSKEISSETVARLSTLYNACFDIRDAHIAELESKKNATKNARPTMLFAVINQEGGVKSIEIESPIEQIISTKLDGRKVDIKIMSGSPSCQMGAKTSNGFQIVSFWADGSVELTILKDGVVRWALNDSTTTKWTRVELGKDDLKVVKVESQKGEQKLSDPNAIEYGVAFAEDFIAAF